MDNICAPSVAARRQEGERFYNCEQTYLLQKAPGGEFNCVLSKTDTTGHYKYSRALAELVHGFPLRDTWQAKTARRVYTHYSQTGATRIDRLYASQELLSRKTNAETEAAAFTGHLAVLLRLSVDIPILRRGRGKWKKNTSFLKDHGCKEKLRQRWEFWKREKRQYPQSTLWWGRFVKKTPAFQAGRIREP